MKRNIELITNRADVSEKSIENYLVGMTRELGGICLKYSNANMVGYPDRIVLLPKGKFFFCELKSKGGRTSKIQDIRFEELNKIGFRVYICNSKRDVDEMLKYECHEI